MLITFSRNTAAVACAILLIIGRWSIDRLYPAFANMGVYGDLRLHLLGLLVMLLTMMIAVRPCVPRRLPALLLLSLGTIGLHLLTIGWAPSPHAAVESVIDLMALWFSVTLIFIFARDREWLKVWVWSAIGISIALTAVGIIGFIGRGDETRLVALGGGPNVFARIIGLGSIGIVYYSLKGQLPYRAGIVTGVLMLLTVVLSGSRGGMVAVFCGMLTMIGLAGVRLRSSIVMLMLSTIIAAGFVRFTHLGTIVSNIFSSRILSLTIENRHISGRELLYDDAMSLWKYSPWYGNGLNSFEALGYGNYPHNVILELGVSGGGIVVAMFLCMVVLFLRLVWKRRRFAIVPILGGWFVMYLTASQFSGDIYDARGIFILAGVLAGVGMGRAKVSDGIYFERA